MIKTDTEMNIIRKYYIELEWCMSNKRFTITYTDVAAFNEFVTSMEV